MRLGWICLACGALASGCPTGGDDAADTPDDAPDAGEGTGDAGDGGDGAEGTEAEGDEGDGSGDEGGEDGGEPVGRWVERTPAGGARPGGRAVHRTVYHPGRGTVVLVGGQAGGPLPRADLWEWDGTTWVEGSPADNPFPARKYHGMAYEPDRGGLLVFGGVHGGLAVPPTYYDDMWRWDGTTWQAVTPAGEVPPARSSHGFVHDGGRGVFVLFGGGTDGPLGDTWEFDGERWVERTGSPSPRARYSAAMAYDEARGRVVLFGGQIYGSLADTWEWDGTAWTEVTPAGESPPARGFHAMTYDPDRRRVVLYGGSSRFPPDITADNTFGDHWEWDGTTWTRRGDGDGPGPRAGAALAYDRTRRRLVLTGGTADGTRMADDVWEFEPID